MKKVPATRSASGRFRTRPSAAARPGSRRCHERGGQPDHRVDQVGVVTEPRVEEPQHATDRGRRVRVRRGPAGQPHTAPWWTLADPDPGLVLLADTDGGATVTAVMFLGPLSRVTCQLADGTDVVAQLASSDALRLQPGDAVRLEVEPSPVLVVA